MMLETAEIDKSASRFQFLHQSKGKSTGGEKLKSDIFIIQTWSGDGKSFPHPRLDLLFVFTLDINPGWELIKKKERKRT